ncbi:hypothetical protein ACTA71_010757 [Dictyostelium dimigraforme]
MKFIYGLLALAASIVVSNAQSCEIGVCVKEGENCDINNYNYTNNAIVSINCEYGTFCPSSSTVFTPVCTKLSGLGEVCGNGFTQCGEPYTCRYSGTDSAGNRMNTCAMPSYLGFGESCNADYQCGSGLSCNNEVCSLLPNVVCTNSGQCPFGQWCNGTTVHNTPVQCQPLLANGAECTDDDQCPYNTYCGTKVGDTSGKTFCQSSFNKNQGDSCASHGSRYVEPTSGLRYECSANLICASNNNTCQVPDIAVPAGDCMDASVSCPYSFGSQCQCTSTSQIKTGSCTQLPLNLNSNCQTTVQNLVSCAIAHECPSIEYISLGPDSCIMKNCKSELCDNNGCVNQNVGACGNQPVYAVCSPPSSSSVVLPSFVLLIVAIIALLF